MILKLLIIFAFFASSFGQDVPNISCDFQMLGTQYTCQLTISNNDGFDEFEGIQGTHLEGMNNLNVTQVIFQSGNSTVVPRILCSQFANVQSLYFQSMGVQNVANNPFGGCGSLTFLRLWNNLIAELPVNTFANNSGLTYLDLDRNRLTELPLNIFQGLSNLLTLELRNNMFEGRLQSGIFRPLTALQTLYLNHCGIPSINRLWFESLSNLQQLWIYNNNITRLTQDQFVGLPALQYVDLDSNQIDTVEAGAFHSRSNLNIVYLYNNRITELVEDVFADLTNVFYLDLDRNRIQTIHDGAFRSMSSLVTLYLDDNNIKHLTGRTFEGLPNVRNLYMNFNEIEDLPTGVFASFNSITNLGLWDNRIKVLSRNYFSNLTTLSFIDLDNNVVNGLERSIFDEALNLQTLWFWNNLCFSGSMFSFQVNRANFMIMLQRCFHNHQYIIDTTTEGSNNYRFFTFPTPGIQLRVNTPSDAHISLNPINFEAIPRIEIHIGAANNTRSIIRRNGSENVVDISTPGILERNSWTGFRIVFSNFVVMVIKEGEIFPFMIFNMNEFYVINFYGVRSPGSNAIWSMQPF